MGTKLILVEGLPGSGKTTISKLIQSVLQKRGLETKLFLEGDLSHPADFESVACIGEEEYHGFKSIYQDFLDEKFMMKENHDFLVPYRKLREQISNFPNELFDFLCKRDIYELDFLKNKDLITNNWMKFAKKAKQEDTIYIFECCFIQNPVTVGMIKYGVSDEHVMEYVAGLAKQAADLNPMLFYINQDDLEATFQKAVRERPVEWSQFFMDYYTTQGYGKALGLKGFEGTLEILKARKELEKKIINQLEIPKVMINNTNYDPVEINNVLKEVLQYI